MFSCYKPLKVIMEQSVTVSILLFSGKVLLCIDKHRCEVKLTSTFPQFLLALGIQGWRYVPCRLLPLLGHGGCLVLSTFDDPWSADSARYFIISRLSIASKSGKELLLTCLSDFAGLPWRAQMLPQGAVRRRALDFKVILVSWSSNSKALQLLNVCPETDWKFILHVAKPDNMKKRSSSCRLVLKWPATYYMNTKTPERVRIETENDYSTKKDVVFFILVAILTWANLDHSVAHLYLSKTYYAELTTERLPGTDNSSVLALGTVLEDVRFIKFQIDTPSLTTTTNKIPNT